jgi:hypothetical protein
MVSLRSVPHGVTRGASVDRDAEYLHALRYAVTAISTLLLAVARYVAITGALRSGNAPRRIAAC